MNFQSDQSNLARGVCQGTKASGVVSVLVGSQTMVAQCPQDLTVASGDIVLIGKFGSSWYIVQRYYTTGIGNILNDLNVEPPVAPVTRTGTNVFLPTRTVTYRGSTWRTDNDYLYQGQYGAPGNNNVGCAFYGAQVKTLHGATVTKAFIKMRRRAGGTHAAQATFLVAVAEFSKPSGPPTLVNSYTGPKLRVGETVSEFDLDVTLAQALVDGTFGGLAVFNPLAVPYLVLDGQGEYSGSMALSISWSKTS